MASLQGTMVARRLIMEMSQALVSTVEIASSPIPTSNSSSIEDIGSYLLSRSKVKPPTIIVILLLITFFLLGFFSIYFRRWYANGDTTAPPNQPTTPSHNTTLAADLPPPPTTTARTTASDLSPLASSKGLDMEIIESLPKIIFSSSSQLHPPTNEKKQTECVICLEGFEEEETLRLIPRCGHIFHSECINMWLLSQTSCPLCRHSLLLPLKADKSSTEDEEEGHGGHSLLVVLQSPPHADQHH